MSPRGLLLGDIFSDLIPDFLFFYNDIFFPIVSWKLKIIAYRGSSMIPTSSKLKTLKKKD